MTLFLLNKSHEWEMYTYENFSELAEEFRKRKITIGANCTIGNGCAIGNYAKIGENCTFGDCCQLDNKIEIRENCSFGERCTIDYHVFVRNNVCVGKFVVLGAETHVGSYAKIGANCIIRIGATVAPSSVLEEFENHVNDNGVPYRYITFYEVLSKVTNLY